MAPSSTALTTKVESGSPYQLSSDQTLKASNALLTHMRASSKPEKTEKKSLLVSEDAEEEDNASSEPVWLLLSTKKHIIDTKRLKPSKIRLPHPISTAPTTTICLITADPQRAYKDVVASPAFPAALSSRITKVVGVKKLKAKHSTYEAQRKLFAEHDIFLADDRIITLLPQALGKTFYKTTTKRPIPVTIAAPPVKVDGKRVTRAKGGEKTGAGEPKVIAAEIEKALSCALVHLSPSASTSVKIGHEGMTPAELAANVKAVTNELVEKLVPKKWRGVKGIHIKGARTAALPIWLADELWTEEADVLDAEAAEKLKAQEANVGKKRKAIEAAKEGEKAAKKQKALPEGDDGKLDREIALRKEKLRKQKAEAAGDVVDDIPKASKKGKGKKVAA